jgi:hypothetical protein
MIRALRRAAAAHVVLIAVVLLASVGVALGAVFVGFTGETQNASTFAGGWIGAPTSLAAPTPSGYDAQLAWTPGTHGPVTGQQLWGVDRGSTSNCTGAVYALLNTMAGASTSTYPKSNTSSVNGHWLCYQMLSTSASAWTASSNFSAVQLGLVAKTVAIANGGGTNSSGKLTANDTITVTFNQPILASSLPVGPIICTGTSATLIIIGDTSATNCSGTTDPYSVGVINGITVSGNKNKIDANVSVSGATLTITLAQNGTTATGTGTFTPAATILSAATTDQAQACTTASTCTPTSTGSF